MGYTIYKYKLGDDDRSAATRARTLGDRFVFEITMPWDARVVSVDAQGEDICVWAMVHTEDIRGRPRRFAVIPTGADISDDMVGLLDRSKFINTVLLHGGALVFHVWSIDKDLDRPKSSDRGR